MAQWGVLEYFVMVSVIVLYTRLCLLTYYTVTDLFVFSMLHVSYYMLNLGNSHGRAPHLAFHDTGQTQPLDKLQGRY